MYSTNFASNLRSLPNAASLPQNIDAEEAILGGILLSPDAIAIVPEILKPEHFSLTKHQVIYQAALCLYAMGKPTDLLSVCTYLSDNRQLEKIGGQAALAQVIDRTVSAVNIDRYCCLVYEKYLRRQLIKVSGDINSLAYEPGEISEILDQAESKIFGLTEQGQTSDRAVAHAGDILVGVFRSLEEICAGESKRQPTGFYDLDEILNGGLAPGNLILLAGRPSMGKTAFAVNIAQNFVEKGKSALIFSLEMGKDELIQRMLAANSGVPASKIATAKLSEEQYSKIALSIGTMSLWPLYIDDSPNPSVMEMRSKCRKMAAQQNLGVVVIDYLQLMGGGGDPTNRVQEVTAITRNLKCLARELQVPIILLSQLNRNLESRNDKRPKMSDFRESGSIEQDADVAIMLYRDEYYNPETTDRGIAEVIIAKHRNGSTGKVKLLFDAEFTKFKNLKK